MNGLKIISALVPKLQYFLINRLHVFGIIRQRCQGVGRAAAIGILLYPIVHVEHAPAQRQPGLLGQWQLRCGHWIWKADQTRYLPLRLQQARHFNKLGCIWQHLLKEPTSQVQTSKAKQASSGTLKLHSKVTLHMLYLPQNVLYYFKDSCHLHSDTTPEACREAVKACLHWLCLPSYVFAKGRLPHRSTLENTP